MSHIYHGHSIASSIGETKVLIQPVGKEGEHLVNGGKLPRDFGNYYQFRLEQVNLKWVIYSDSNIDGSKTIIKQELEILMEERKMNQSLLIRDTMSHGSTLHLRILLQ